ncbi:MAG TPA: hypothetical protein VNJ08_12920 [Bacteriovoracaceae bacterium]|nr:hypothetical protein [Bacteriovoracaceae bacterium]
MKKIVLNILLFILCGLTFSCNPQIYVSDIKPAATHTPTGEAGGAGGGGGGGGSVVTNSIKNYTSSDYPTFASYTSAVKASIISHNFLNSVGNVKVPTGEQLLKASYLMNLFYDRVKNLSGTEPLVITPAEQAEFGTLNLQVFKLAMGSIFYYGVEEMNPKIYGHGVALMKSNFGSMANKLLIEVPHPMWDSNTGELGGEVMDTMNPALFIMAGHHRYNSTSPSTTTVPGNSGQFRTDAAHETALFFHIAHTVFAQDITYVVQLHGYGSGMTDLYAAIPPIEFVLASGAKQNPPAILTTLKAAFTAAGMNGAIYPTDSTSLGATENVQGSHVRERFPDRFIHVETRTELRANATQRAKIVTALQSTL